MLIDYRCLLRDQNDVACLCMIHIHPSTFPLIPRAGRIILASWCRWCSLVLPCHGFPPRLSEIANPGWLPLLYVVSILAADFLPLPTAELQHTLHRRKPQDLSPLCARWDPLPRVPADSETHVQLLLYSHARVGCSAPASDTRTCAKAHVRQDTSSSSSDGRMDRGVLMEVMGGHEQRRPCQ